MCVLVELILECMPTHHTWRPIEDLATDPKALADSEMDSLAYMGKAKERIDR